MTLQRVSNLLLLAAVCLGESPRPLVTTSYGLLRGRNLLSQNGRQYFSFTSVPFARPPLDSLRFKSPQPPEPWAGVLDATKPSPLCPQVDRSQDQVIGQEDCLYLTINTPNISSSLPVLVYIHGGGFSMGPTEPGSGTIEMGANFMNEDVVLVAFRYRLGILGFLSMEDEELPGNYGLKDMAAALEWVKKEIHNFGGNPELISVFGISAGGASSHYMCSIPQTRKLLKGCISQSGVAGNYWSLQKKGAAKAQALQAVQSLGCTGNKVLPCLQAKSLKELVVPQKGNGLQYVPSIEPVHDGALITEWPPKDSKQDFPWITGHTANEGILITGVIANFQGESGLEPYLKNWEEYYIKTYHLKTDAKEKAKKIHDRFFLDKDVFTAIEQLSTETMFAYPALKAASLHSGPKYFYVFNYTGGPTSLELGVRRKLNVTGVCHADDEGYFFSDKNGYKPEGWPSPEDIQFIQSLIKFWVEFARTQNPNWSSEMPWNQFIDGKYQNLAHKISMQDYTKADEIIAFWDSIFE